MDNRSAFNVSDYDGNVRRVIPLYDLMYEQIFGVIKAHCGQGPLALLDTGCGTGTFGLEACERLELSELVLCDPSEKMLDDANQKLSGRPCEFVRTGSEGLDFRDRFDVVTAIQSHHYFDRETRELAVKKCYNALRPGGIFIYFENTAPFSEAGKAIMLRRLEEYELRSGRTSEEVKAHSARYGKEFFPITIKEHLDLLERTGFRSRELFWFSYMQGGFYGIKGCGIIMETLMR